MESVRLVSITGSAVEFADSGGFDIVPDDNEVWIYDRHMRPRRKISLDIIEYVEHADKHGFPLKSWGRDSGLQPPLRP